MNAYYVESMGETDRDKVKELLRRNGLALEFTVDYTAVLKHKGRLVGTCSCEKNVLKSFVVQTCYQGSGGASQLLTHVINKLFDEGYFTVMAYTFSKNRSVFEGMHFRTVYDTGDVCLLTTGIDNLETSINMYLKNLDACPGLRSAIVMNGNPFTKGHQYLIESASKESDEVLVFVVEEEGSAFSFDQRFEMIRQGTTHLENVKVLPGGPYMVSMATFPNYFVRDHSDKARFSAELDAGIFGSLIAPALEIHRRYVGSEPFCKMTAMYNQALTDLLYKHGVELRIIERKEAVGKAISASEVRRLLVGQDWAGIQQIVPKTTLNFLQSDQSTKSIETLRKTVRSH